MGYIMRFLGLILELLQNISGNYGITIILFTILIKAILLPLTIKQQKSTAHMQKIQPLLAEAQRKYANDKEKLNKETMKLYQEYKVNPMSGCLPLVIQLPIIMALYWVVRKPITYIMGISPENIWQLAEAFNAWAAANASSIPAKLAELIPLSYTSSNSTNTFGANEIQVAQVINKYYSEMMQDSNFVAIAGDTIYKVKQISFNFLGINLADTPELGPLLGLLMGKTAGITRDIVILWIVPVMSAVTAYFSGVFTTKAQERAKTQTQKLQEQENPATGNMNMMMKIMPLFSAWITFSLPAAVGFYWIISNVIQLLQQIYFDKFINPKINNDIIEAELIADVKKSRKKRKKSG